MYNADRSRTHIRIKVIWFHVSVIRVFGERTLRSTIKEFELRDEVADAGEPRPRPQRWILQRFLNLVNRVYTPPHLIVLELVIIIDHFSVASLPCKT